MKSKYATFALMAVLVTPSMVRGQTTTCPSDEIGSLARILTPTVLVCANGIPHFIGGILVDGKFGLLPTTIVDLGDGASFSVGAAFNSDPSSNFTFGSVLPFGFGPISYDAYFSTPVAPGAYTHAASSGTLGVTVAGPSGSTGTVTMGTYPFYISGYADATNLGVDTGSGTCTVSTPTDPNSTTCNIPDASNNFGPMSPLFLTAHLSYTHNTTVSGTSTVGWTGAVILDTTATPEPATVGLVLTGFLGIAGFRARRRQA